MSHGPPEGGGELVIELLRVAFSKVFLYINCCGSHENEAQNNYFSRQQTFYDGILKFVSYFDAMFFFSFSLRVTILIYLSYFYMNINLRADDCKTSVFFVVTFYDTRLVYL